MFDIVKDYSAQLVIIDQILTTFGTEFYTKICVDVEVVKNQRDNDFRHYIFNTVNAKIRSYLTNSSYSLDKKYESANFIMMSAILEFFHNPEFELDDEDISLMSNNLNLENAHDTLADHFKNKYGEERVDRYLKLYDEFVSPMSFALSVYTNYKSAKGNGFLTQQHLDTFKMIMGKEFMESAYENSGEPTSSGSQNTSSSSSSTKAGCYVATCVYHSYDCPEVWALRRYRDYYLKERLFGRIFIKVYYAISPTIVKWFGKTKWFNNIFKKYLNRKVKRLIESGYSTSQYYD